MDEARRHYLVERYREGPRVLAEMVQGLSDADLDLRPADHGWTPREIVHHVADSEMTSAIRLRRLLAEESPIIAGYDENLFARRLYYDRRAIASSLDAVSAARKTSAEILEHLTGDEWGRTGTHSEGGPYGVEIWLEIYAAHCHDHAAQVDAVLRQARGGGS